MRKPVGADESSADAPIGAHLRFGPVAALIIGAILRFYALGMRSLWTDEGSTWTASTLPLHDLLERCVRRDASPPLYYLLSAAALRLGNDEAHLRLVSAIASLAMVWLTYRLARLALPRSVSTFAAVLTALAPFQVMYAQEARTYTLVAALTVGATVAYGTSLLRPTRGSWAALVLTTTLGLWTQTISALGGIAQGAIAVLTPEGRRKFLPWVGAIAASVVLYLPWAWYGRGLSEHLGSSHWYVPDPDAHSVFKVLRAAIMSPMPIVTAPPGSQLPGLDHWMPRQVAWGLVALPPLVALALTLPALLRRDGRGPLARLAWAGWLVPVVAVYIVSMRQPLLLARYFVFVTPFLSVLYAIGIATLPNRPARWILGTWFILLSFVGLVRYERDYTKEPWRQVAADIGARSAPGRTAVLVPYDVDPFAFYDRGLPRPVAAFEVSHPNEPFAAAFTPRELDELESAARRDAAPYDEVWVIVRSPNSAVRREVAARAERVAGEGRQLTERRQWDSFLGPLRVARFVRDSTVMRPAPAAAGR
jgi:hypothetical protein